MNILLNIAYHTNFGEELVLNVMNAKTKATTPFRMKTVDGKMWTCSLELDLQMGTHIDYYYSVVRGANHMVNCEWMVEPHRLEINAIK